jgi:hypothetical protein
LTSHSIAHFGNGRQDRFRANRQTTLLRKRIDHMMTPQGKWTSNRREPLILTTILFILIALYPDIGLSESSALPGAKKVSEIGRTIPSPGSPYWWVQIDFQKSGEGAGAATPWTDEDFANFAKAGINGVEINLVWGSIEPRQGEYDFALLDSYLASAAKAHIKLYLIFWQSVWAESPPKVVGKNPPLWVTGRDLTSAGMTTNEPSWWDKESRQAYFDYMCRTIEHINGKPGFGGMFANYGWLDAMWGPENYKGAGLEPTRGIAGYAPADIQEFYQWLPRTYKTLAAFNDKWHTTYAEWSQVPAAKPGEPLFPVYQHFRYQSVVQTYDEISHLVRARTKAPLLYYWGGMIGGDSTGVGVMMNAPDIFFKTAKRYNAIVVLDDADYTGLSLVFGSLARSYKVPLFEEWTPQETPMQEETARWLGHIAMGAPYEIGADFFVYPPPKNPTGWAEAWPKFQAWHTTIAQIKGNTPEQPVAVLIPMKKIAFGQDLNALSGWEVQLGNFWRTHHVMPRFITDEQVTDGTVDLGQFKAVVDLGNERADLPELNAYAEKHLVLKSLSEAVPLLRPYVTLDPAYDFLEVTPVVDGKSVWLTLANCNGEKAYAGNIEFDPQAVGLESTDFDVTIVKGGESVPASRTQDGKIQWQINLPPAGFEVIHLSPRKSTLH